MSTETVDAAAVDAPVVERRSVTGEVLSVQPLDPEIFGVTVNVPLLHQVVTAQLVLQRRAGGPRARRPAPRCAAVAPSRTGRRGPAALDRARFGRRTFPAVVLPLDQSRAATRSARRRRWCRRRCGARSRTAPRRVRSGWSIASSSPSRRRRTRSLSSRHCRVTARCWWSWAATPNRRCGHSPICRSSSRFRPTS